MAHDPLDHVLDDDKWVFFEALNLQWPLPSIHIPIINYELQITRFMILELMAVAIILAIYIPLARRIQTGGLPKGRWWNAFESLLTFVRDDVVEPIGTVEEAVLAVQVEVGEVAAHCDSSPPVGSEGDAAVGAGEVAVVAIASAGATVRAAEP